MKNIVTLVFALLLYKWGAAQTMPLLAKDKIWYTCEAFKEQPVIEFDNRFRDTVWIDSLSYLEVLEVKTYPPYDTILVGWIREDSIGRVYYRDANNYLGRISCADSVTDYLLYDFSLKKGDTLRMGSTVIAKVYDMDTVVYKGVARKRWKISWVMGMPNPYAECWQYADVIEGIGNTRGLLEFAWYKFENGFELKCVQDSGRQLYPDTFCWCTIESSVKDEALTKVRIVPNPASDNFILSNLPQNCAIEVFASDGQLLFATRNASLNNLQVDVSGYPAGLYMVHLRSSEYGATRLLSIIH